MKKAKRASKQSMPVIGWAGIVGGKIHDWSIDGGPSQFGIWRLRKEAAKRFEVVRKVEIRFTR